MDNLCKKVALITGGSRGIGKAIVEKFIENDYRVAFTYFNSEDSANEICQNYNKNDTLNVIAIKCNIEDCFDIKSCVEKVIKVFGKIDVLVNNAGISSINLFIDTNKSEWNRVLKTNLDSVYHFSNIVIPYMLEKGGNIINISSVWGVYGASMEVAYSTSKAGIIGFTKALSKELGYNNIRVNAIAPGVIDTDMNKNISDEIKKELIEKTPLARLGTPIDIANTVLFLVSDNASFITGQVIEVTGGFIG